MLQQHHYLKACRASAGMQGWQQPPAGRAVGVLIMTLWLLLLLTPQGPGGKPAISQGPLQAT